MFTIKSNEVLKISSGIEVGGGVVWRLALCLLFCWVVVYLVLIKGIQSLGKVSYFSTIFPYVLLTIMLIRGVTLDGAREGVLYYIKPDFKKLAVASTWSDAATQIFYSLTICTGCMTTMASFNPFHNNILRDAILVPIINCLTSFYGGFAIFSILGYMSKQKGVPIDQVADQGAGLIFVVYPEALSKMPIAPLWSFSSTEVTLSAIIDEFPVLRRTRWHDMASRAVACFAFYLFGLILVTNGGFYYLNLVDFYLGGVPLLIAGLLEFVAVIYIYGYSNFAMDIKMMLGRKVPMFFTIAWYFISPALLLIVTVAAFVQMDVPVLMNRPLPFWAVVVGWMFVLLTLISIPVWFLYYYARSGGWQLLKNLSHSTDSWGPADDENRTGRYARRRLASVRPTETMLQGNSNIGCSNIGCNNIDCSNIDCNNTDCNDIECNSREIITSYVINQGSGSAELMSVKDRQVAYTSSNQVSDSNIHVSEIVNKMSDINRRESDRNEHAFRSNSEKSDDDRQVSDNGNEVSDTGNRTIVSDHRQQHCASPDGYNNEGFEKF
ncbi:hypothetical protein HELRODRAFT_179366 [Helobdella robusta]|uniref:Uncharacterized protein n=1 Tax=Helobdella robusta TaxID=6412 RepID=T1FEM0_HELRO|nr:hypothetical protein HELRODRAFT_179366 [Helobdella robusta]ESN95588.1 hypothetical protein HELRODRAFT_179366 [Helobdella robusta]